MVDTYVNRSEFIVWLVDCSPNKKLRFKWCETRSSTVDDLEVGGDYRLINSIEEYISISAI